MTGRKSKLYMIEILFAGYDSIHPSDFVIDTPDGFECYIMVMANTPARFLHNGVLEPCPAGCSVLYPPHHPIYYCADNGPFSDNWIYFNTSDPSFGSFPAPGTPIRMSDPAYLRRLYQLVAWESAPETRSPEILEHLMRVMYLRMLNDYTVQGQTPMQYALSRLRKEIVNNPEYPWTVAHMARQLSISPGYLQTMYKKEFGVSCIDDVISIRLRKAQEILSYTDDSIAEAAASCGYRNVEHFIRQFHRATGTSPAAFRKAQRAAALEACQAPVLYMPRTDSNSP